MSRKSKTGELVAGEESPVASKSVQRRLAVQAPADILTVLARAASDPATDVTKLTALVGLYERIKASEANVAYATALAEMQTELPLISERGGIKNSRGDVQSAYAFWEDIVGQITPILSKHGFSLSFRTGSGSVGHSTDGTPIQGVSVTGILTHKGGHSAETTLALPVDTSGSKNPVQAVGSSVSYGKRYTASALLNLRTGEKDDDGQAGGGSAPQFIDETQQADLKALLEETGANFPAFLKWAKVNALGEILSVNFKTVCDMVRTRARAK